MATWRENATWRKLLSDEMSLCGETLADVEYNTMSDAEMDVEFDATYGNIEGRPFTVWTQRRVYFPVGYDGRESVGSVSRNIDMQPTSHIGGG